MFTFCPKTGYEKDLETLAFWWSIATSRGPHWFRPLFLSHCMCWVQGDGQGKEGVSAAFKCTECTQLLLAPGVGDRGCFQLSSLWLSDNTQGFGQQELQQQTCTSMSKEWGETQWPCSVSLGHAPLWAGPRVPWSVTWAGGPQWFLSWEGVLRGQWRSCFFCLVECLSQHPIWRILGNEFGRKERRICMSHARETCAELSKASLRD